MAKKKKTAKPRRRRAVATPPPQCGADTDDIQVLKQKRFAVLYEGLNTKEEILERWEDEILAPIHDEEGLLTEEHAELLVLWWREYKRNIFTNDHETVETVILKIKTDAFVDTLTRLFRPVRYRNSVLKRVYELIDGLGKARRSANPSDEMK
jgi:hypothetical protein